MLRIHAERMAAFHGLCLESGHSAHGPRSAVPFRARSGRSPVHERIEDHKIFVPESGLSKSPSGKKLSLGVGCDSVRGT